MAFKADEDFRRYVAMGASAATHAAAWLSGRHGHLVIELERHATANKIWATKVKRVRVPDLVCLNCGRRVEARAKPRLKIEMSHSKRRPWDEGLREDDLCAFLAWDGARQATYGDPQCFRVGDMREAYRRERLEQGQRKAFSEGAEATLVWAAWAPRNDSLVEDITDAAITISYATAADRRRRQVYTAFTRWRQHWFYADVGASLPGGAAFLVGTVAPCDDLGCPGPTWDLNADLHAEDRHDRFVAVKAAGRHERAKRFAPRLMEIAENDPDPRIRLEAVGSLARIDPESHIAALTDWALRRCGAPARSDESAYGIEAIFILSELDTEHALAALERLAESNALDSEARCAAVWGLGIAGANQPERLLKFVGDPDDEVALHAIAGFDLSSRALIPVLRRMLDLGGRRAESGAALLRDMGGDAVPALLEVARAEHPAAPLALGALAQLPAAVLHTNAGERLDAAIAERLRLVRAALSTWLGRYRADDPVRELRRETARPLR